MRRTLRDNKRRRSRGGMIDGLGAVASSAVLPFGFFSVQKMFQKNRRVPSLRNIYSRSRNTRRFK